MQRHAGDNNEGRPFVWSRCRAQRNVIGLEVEILQVHVLLSVI